MRRAPLRTLCKTAGIAWACASGLGLLAGCSYTFDEPLPGLTLIGERPDMSRLPRLNRAPAEDAYTVLGHDGTPWLAILEPNNLIRVRRLAPPDAEEELRGKSIFIRWRAFYIFEPGDPRTKAPTRLRVRAAGAPDQGQEFLLPPGDGYLATDGGNTAFVYWIKSKETKTFDLYRRDGSFHRELPVPAKTNPAQPFEKGGFFDGSGRRLYVRDGDGRVKVYSTRDENDGDLGVQPQQMILLDSKRMLTCGEEKDPMEVRGLRVVSLDGGAEPLLLDQACTPGALWISGGQVYYTVKEEMRRVALAGGGTPEVVFNNKGRQVLLFGPNNTLVYSTTPPQTFRGNAGDGWLGDWRFMDRGRLPSFSNDGKRMRWLENAATISGSGTLQVAPIGGEPRVLAQNVWAYSELFDGRLLTVANYAFFGTQNRIIAIDEAAGHAQWVADSASYFTYIPGSTDILVYLTRSNLTFDLVRVPIPPRVGPQ
jgi:hypothetical protein